MLCFLVAPPNDVLITGPLPEDVLITGPLRIDKVEKLILQGKSHLLNPISHLLNPSVDHVRNKFDIFIFWR